jgi:hypothetical protein
VTDHETAHVELDLAQGVEPISGRLRAGGVPARSFSGVLELIALLDDARMSPGDTGRPQPSTEASP